MGSPICFGTEYGRLPRMSSPLKPVGGLAYNTANAVGSPNVGSSSMPGESQELDVRKSTRTWSHDHFSAYRFQEDTCNSSIFNFGPPVLTSLFF